MKKQKVDSSITPKVIEKQEIITTPTPKHEKKTIVLAAKQYKNVSHLIKSMRNQIRKAGLSNDFIIDFLPAKHNQSAQIIIQMGAQHRMKILPNTFWTHVYRNGTNKDWS